jgi:hypothetical protein
LLLLSLYAMLNRRLKVNNQRVGNRLQVGHVTTDNDPLEQRVNAG